MEFLFVALGGAAGAVSRYAISLIPVKSGFPILTLMTNIIGAVLIGFIAVLPAVRLKYLKIRFYSGKQGCAVDLPHFQHFHWKHIICLIMESM